MTIYGEVSSLFVAARLIPSSFALVRVLGDYLEAANENNPDGTVVPVTTWIGGVSPSLGSTSSLQSSGDEEIKNP
jgi:hypothetical protein